MFGGPLKTLVCQCTDHCQNDFASSITFGAGYLQDALPYAHDAGPLISVALEACEAVAPTVGHAVAGL
jgi:hypothetical protein